MKISVIIPVLNEGDRINYLICHIGEIFSVQDHEIIVSDCDEQGSTIKVIQDSRVIKINSPKGRAIQMNNGAMAATGQILLFLHADTMLPTDACEELLYAFSKNNIVAGAFDLSFDVKSFGMNLISLVARIRSRITRIPFGDQAIFIRKEYFESMGGFKNIPLMEDVELFKRIKKNKDKIYISPERVITSARKWQNEGAARTTLRNWILQLLFAFGVPPEKFAGYYYRQNHDSVKRSKYLS